MILNFIQLHSNFTVRSRFGKTHISFHFVCDTRRGQRRLIRRIETKFKSPFEDSTQTAYNSSRMSIKLYEVCY